MQICTRPWNVRSATGDPSRNTNLFRCYCDLTLVWSTRPGVTSDLLSACCKSGGKGRASLGFVRCLCIFVIISEQFGASYASSMVSNRFSTSAIETWNLSLCNTLQFWQEAKENIWYAKVHDLHAFMWMVSLRKSFWARILTYWQLPAVDVRGVHFVERTSFQLILFLNQTLDLECCITNGDGETFSQHC